VARVDLHMRNTKPWTVLIVLAASSLTHTASADPTKADDNYGYIFVDPDLLSAEGSVVTAVPIRVQKHPRREVLLRPRVHFVTEMLKSVEGL
jgi:hypothetical protein